ncbi:ATP-binding protein [Rubinisphaera italica]|uniref:Serine-protein kinase RsbW n=1 Tax=Rubinisphaera italica TaxID=2527969 RepID=A0A5C5XD49_9PLAN|nr:ATP-binding protein [Rubinisphaera italica]TWT60233.1 Serine-protein kinase RsbW [Rubinisphaera italica]
MPPTNLSNSSNTKSGSAVIPSDEAAALDVQDQIIELLESFSFSDRDLFSIRLALAEAITNAIRHGNRMDPSKTVTFKWAVTAQRISVNITDEGTGFDPASLIDPTEEENLERPGGRGVLLIRNFMDEVIYNAQGNSLTMIKQMSVSE